MCAQCSDAAPKQAAAADAHTNCAACLSWLAFGTQAPAHRMASAVTGSPFVYGAAPAWAWRRLNASCRRAGPGVTATASANASIARPGATILPHSWWAGLPGKPLDVSLLKGKILLRKTQNTTSHSLTLRSGDCDCSNAEMPSLTSHRCFRDFFEMHNLQPNENAQRARNNVDGLAVFSMPPPGGLARLRALSLPFLVCRRGGVSFVAYRAQLGRVGGSRWGWVLHIKYRAIKPTFLSPRPASAKRK